MSKCKFCDETTNNKVNLWGESYKYLKKDERACMDCYIEHCVEEKIMKIFNLKRVKDDEKEA